MPKPKQDVWTAFDASDVYRMERKVGDDKPASEAADFSDVDFERGEKIELTAGSSTARFSNMQYFSTPQEFKERFHALLGWTSKANLSTIHGVITIKDDFLDMDNLLVDRAQDAIQQFEDFFVSNIRVPRKYTPPSASGCNNRKSDSPGYKDIKGNFDLVCRTPGNGGSPHRIEFVLYDCGYEDARRKLSGFMEFANELGLVLEVDISQYIGQNPSK